MRTTLWALPFAAVALLGVLWGAAGSFAEPPAKSKKTSAKKGKPAAKKKADTGKRVSVEQARERAKLTHNIYSATLDVMHHRYFRAERTSVPARAMEDVFAEISRQENIKANWIAVNARAMSIDHRPKGDFEKKAAKILASGKNEYEEIKHGLYRRAERISLMNRGCLGCHLGFGASGTTKRFAGLVITIPVKKK
jgi:hypothetical protein